MVKQLFLHDPNLFNNLRWTLGRTFPAVGALLIINHSQVIVHMDGIKLTLLRAEGTSDASGVAVLLHCRPLVVGITLNKMLRLIGNQLDQAAGTYCHTLATGHTFLLIHNGYPINDMDGVELTCLYTAS